LTDLQAGRRANRRIAGRSWHVGKVLFERAWMGTGVERALAALALRVGARTMGVETSP